MDIQSIKNKSDNTYYLRHFNIMLSETMSRYMHLLTDREIEILDKFKQLNILSRQFYIRLFNRKPVWFSPNRIFYPEIGNIEERIDDLIKIGLLSYRKPLKSEFDGYFNSVTVDELRQMGFCFKLKLELYPDIMDNWQSAKTLLAPRLKIEEESVFSLIMLLYFGNLYFDLSRHVIDETGHLKYVKYKLSENLLWKSRLQVDSFLDASIWKRDIWGDLHEERFQRAHKSVLSGFRELKSYKINSDSFRFKKTGAYVRIKFLIKYMDHYRKTYPGAFELFIPKFEKIIPSGELRSLFLEKSILFYKKQKNNKKVSQYLKKFIDNYFIPTFHEIEIKDKTTAWLNGSKRRLPKVKEITVTLTNSSVKSSQNQNRKMYRVGERELTVEQSIIAILQNDGFNAYHVENTLIPTLAGLFFYDEIFSPVNGQFQSKFQEGPLDFYSYSFFSVRKSVILKRYNDLMTISNLSIIFNELWNRLYKFAIHGVVWNLPLIMDFSHLSQHNFLRQTLALQLRYLQFPYEHKRGMPDLVVFSKENSDHFFFAEVKSPKDRLSDAQRAWIQFMKENKIYVKLFKIIERK